MNVHVDETGVAVDENTGGSTFTDVGASCTLEEFAAGKLHDVIPGSIFPALVVEVSRLLGRPLSFPATAAPTAAPPQGSADPPELVGVASADIGVLMRRLTVTRDPDDFGACIDALVPHGVERADRWVALGASDAPRLGRPREAPSLPYWIGANPGCARCGDARTTLVFAHDGLRHQPLRDPFRDAACEVRCPTCGAFSVHVRHDES
jgi:hypothetical protein